MPPRASSIPFGFMPDGRPVTLYTLANRQGMLVKVSDFGGIITEIHVPDRHGELGDVVLGFDSLEDYLNDSDYFGALIGRYANRIRGGRFELDGAVVELEVNNGGNHLHGGPGGFHRALWQAAAFASDDSVGITLAYRSADGEQGYKGNLDVQVTYELNGDNEFSMRFAATSDRPTPVNLTQHSYFNLAGKGDILDHCLCIDADAYLPIGPDAIPLGISTPVAGTPFDFRTPRLIGERIDEKHAQLSNAGGYDHTFVLNKPQGALVTRAARLEDPGSGRWLEVLTQEPGLQCYSGNFLDGSARGKGREFHYRSGLCLEPQHFPDSPNQPHFPNTVLRPGQRYATMSAYRFGVDR